MLLRFDYNHRRGGVEYDSNTIFGKGNPVHVMRKSVKCEQSSKKHEDFY